MSALELKIPPPLVTLCTGLLMWLLAAPMRRRRVAARNAAEVSASVPEVDTSSDPENTRPETGKANDNLR